VGDDGVGDTGLALSQPVRAIANIKSNPHCVLLGMNFLSPTLEAGKGCRNLNAASR